jgi:hypothetical protein
LIPLVPSMLSVIILVASTVLFHEIDSSHEG